MTKALTVDRNMACKRHRLAYAPPAERYPHPTLVDIAIGKKYTEQIGYQLDGYTGASRSGGTVMRWLIPSCRVKDYKRAKVI